MNHLSLNRPRNLSTLRARNFILLLLIFSRDAPAQVAALSNSSVSGPFFFRQLQLTADAFGNVTDSRSAGGAITFDGSGHYTINASLSVGTQAGTSLTGTGLYSIGSSGAMAIGNPLRNSLSINARVGTEAIVGSTTESGDNVFDLFIAIPAAQTSSVFSGPYYVSSLDFPFGSSTYVRNALFTFAPNSNGSFGSFNVTGHALNISSGQVFTQALPSASYALSNGSGTISFGGSNSNIGGTKSFYVSASGNILIGGALDGSSQDFLIGVRTFSGTAALANWSGLFYTGGLRFDVRNAASSAYVGAWNAVPSLGKVSTYQREHQLGLTGTVFDYTSYQNTALNSDGTYMDGGFNVLGLGASGKSFVTANLSTQFDQKGFSLDFGIAVPAFAGTGVYISPVGVVSGASLSPTGGAIAPGQFISIFGSGLADQLAAASAPFPSPLNGVTVTVNGVLAPVSVVSPTQINAIVPYSVSGNFATVAVTNGGQSSNLVTVPLAPTAPGVFTIDSTGTGLGAISHGDGSAVTTANPAKKGETVQIYLTGLGAVSPSVLDGFPGNGNPLSNADAAVTVYVAGQPTSILYAGLAPGFAGVYQINVKIPTGLVGSGMLALIIQTVEGLDEQADIAVQ